MRTRLITISSLLIATVFGTSGASAGPNLPTRTSAEAAVTVKATPRPLTATTWEFDLVFDTHSRELNDDLEKTAVLVTNGGKTFAPVKWQGDPPGGHHRKGVLQFKPISPLPASIELRITRDGEPKPRVFQWPLK
ncbi:MAG: hypothetical protein OEZ08_13390 [Betaproteobacteria bacterium]|nr:hypothetical protein [Betaproteobacteria bacterium]